MTGYTDNGRTGWDLFDEHDGHAFWQCETGPALIKYPNGFSRYFSGQNPGDAYAAWRSIKRP